MPKKTCAEPQAGTQTSSVGDSDNQLTQRQSTSTSRNPPHLRIVHNADRPRTPSSTGESEEAPPPVHAHRPTDPPPAMLDRAVQVQIGHMLRDVFAGVADEPVPERFVTLLAELAAKEKSR